MSSLDVRGALRRRWYLLAAGVLATAALMALAVTSVGATHEVKSSVLLLPPQVAVVDYPAREATPNPFLRLEGMDPVVSVLITRMMSKEVSDRLLEGRPGGTYQLVQDPTTQAPIIVVTASGPTDAEAERIRDLVVADMPARLQELQVHASVPADARITLTDLVADPEAIGSWKGLIRILILLAAAGAVGTVLFVGAVDGVARARKQARSRRPAARQEVDPAPGPIVQEAAPEDVRATGARDMSEASSG